MRKALLIGINDYTFAPLHACVPDARRMANILSRDFDGTPNFTCKTLVSPEIDITKEALTDAIIDLYNGEPDIALLYFSGHGCEQTRTNQACLVTQDSQRHTEGVPFEQVMSLAAQSKAKEKIIILDCCFSGGAGECSWLSSNSSFLNEGTSILASSRKSEVSFENPDGGVFTTILVEALEGGAADTTGLVTVAGMYSFADKLLGPWDQRPIFKSYVSQMIPIRKCKPIVPLEILRRLTIHFSDKNFEFKLDETYEPDVEPKGHDNEKIFSDLQKYNRASLLLPVDEEHMYFAAINRKSCILTPLGKYYWQLIKEGRL